MKLRQALKGKLNKKEMEVLVTSYDMVGDIAIIDIPIELEKKQKLIGETLLKLNKIFQFLKKKLRNYLQLFKNAMVLELVAQMRTVILF